nr:Tn3 family transposase [Streptomyces sp. NRRL B-24720]
MSKTLHILRLADEPGYRRQIKSQANLQEGRHFPLARKIFHGRSRQLSATRTAWKTKSGPWAWS